MSILVVVPWLNEKQVSLFADAWNLSKIPDWLVLQQDVKREGCGITKNRGIKRAMDFGAETVVVLDDDCFPTDDAPNLEILVEKHFQALQPQPVELFQTVTDPPSRGTPYAERSITMPVAASMGFWSEIGDYCAVRQLAHEAAPMTFRKQAIFGRYFPLSGMNIAFRPRDWLPWCQFIEVPRFDDIWMGWLWQREAYRRGYCFNLNGPTVRHSRQSNVWKNLEDEARYLKQSETLWREIAAHEHSDYESLRRLLPV